MRSFFRLYEKTEARLLNNIDHTFAFFVQDDSRGGDRDDKSDRGDKDDDTRPPGDDDQ